ncbi:hypothetical protein BZG36_01385 [Bifiguratus adelaidae]|uniref:Uncharacterized protein n=1 Tax=Bifiguratus adelaidae TaxID=1938954 RepID=A0A261Y3B6_9FUNG|nr:hypothetical protein BZG36_01385 [Bifiguratus adelaidae]
MTKQTTGLSEGEKQTEQPSQAEQSGQKDNGASDSVANAGSAPSMELGSVSPEVIMANIKAVKERVINTGKLYKLISTKEAELTSLRTELADLKASLTNAQKEIHLLTTELDIFKADADRNRHRQQEVDSILAKHRDDMDKLRGREDALNQELSLLKRQLEDAREMSDSWRSKYTATEMIKTQLEYERQENAPSKTVLLERNNRIKVLEEELKTRQVNSAADVTHLRAQKEEFDRLKGVEKERDKLRTDYKALERDLKRREIEAKQHLKALEELEALRSEYASLKEEHDSDKVAHEVELSMMREELHKGINGAGATKNGSPSIHGDDFSEMNHKLIQENAKLTKQNERLQKEVERERQRNKNLAQADQEEHAAHAQASAQIAELKNLLKAKESELATAKFGQMATGSESSVTELQVLRDENEKMLKEKRVLQDVNTEHLVTIAELKVSLRSARINAGRPVEASPVEPHPTDHQIETAIELSPPPKKRKRRTKAELAAERASQREQQQEDQVPPDRIETCYTAVVAPNSPMPLSNALLSPLSTPRDRLISIKRMSTKDRLQEMKNLLKTIQSDSEHLLVNISELDPYVSDYLDVFLVALESIFTTQISELTGPEVEVSKVTRHELPNDASAVLLPTYFADADVAIARFLYSFWHRQTESVRGVMCDWFARMIFKYAISAPDRKGQPHRRFVRTYAVICRNADNSAMTYGKYLRVLCFDLMRELPPGNCMLDTVSDVFAVYPEAFSQIVSDPKNFSHICLYVIQSIFAGLVEALQSPFAMSVSSNMQRFGWAPHDAAPFLDDLINDILCILKSEAFQLRVAAGEDNTEDEAFTLAKALELAAYHYPDWPTAYQQIINAGVGPLMASGKLVNLCLEITGSVGRTALSGSDFKPGVEDLITWMEGTLQHGTNLHEGEFHQQEAAAHTILILASGDQSKLATLLDWFQHLDSRHLSMMREDYKAEFRYILGLANPKL